MGSGPDFGWHWTHLQLTRFPFDHELVYMCILVWSNKTMNRENLKRSADMLLARVERDPWAPHYRESTFKRKLYDSNRRALNLPLPSGGLESNILLQSEWADVIEAANLTDRQLTILGLRLEGYTFEQIGELGGHTKQGAQNIFFQGAKKLARAWMDYPYRGLASVYRDEVRRGAKSRS